MGLLSNLFKMAKVKTGNKTLFAGSTIPDDMKEVNLTFNETLETDLTGYFALKNRVESINRFNYNFNLKTNIGINQIENIIYHMGGIAFFYHEPSNSIVFCDYAETGGSSNNSASGSIDNEGFIKSVQPVLYSNILTVDGVNYDLGGYVRSMLINEEIFIITDQTPVFKMRRSEPKAAILAKFAKMQQNAFEAVRASMMASLKKGIVFAETEGQRYNLMQQLSVLNDPQEAFIVLTNKDLFKDMVQYNNGTTFEVEPYLNYITYVKSMAEDFTGAGDGTSYQSKERNLTGEVNGQTKPVGFMLQDGLLCRKLALDLAAIKTPIVATVELSSPAYGDMFAADEAEGEEVTVTGDKTYVEEEKEDDATN